jgi:hypothetical protein
VKQLQISNKILENPLRDITSLNNSVKAENRPLMIINDNYLYQSNPKEDLEKYRGKGFSKDFSAQSSTN